MVYELSLKLLKPSTQKNIRVTLLTVGEYPTKNGLHASQIMPFAEYLVEKRIACKWIAFCPIRAWMKDTLTGQFKLSKMIEFASEKGVSLMNIPFPIDITRLESYLFRDFLIEKAGAKLAKMIDSSKNDELHVVHCRSYFAAAVALAARNINQRIRVSFDMRSLLSAEVPQFFPRIGSTLYGGLKIWESYLLMMCDYSFLQTKQGIALLANEGHSRLPKFMPIMGFDSTEEELRRIQLPTKPAFAYVGGFGPWQSSLVLDEVFSTIFSYLPDSDFKVFSSSQVTFSTPVQVSSISNREVKRAIQYLWAMVVPGSENLDGYFESMQLHANLFSTKAAEALSVGVPLIVNHKITELANYVNENGCGLVFSVKKGKIHFHGIELSELRNSEMWNNLRKAAISCSPTFNRSRIFESYLGTWRELNDPKTL